MNNSPPRTLPLSPEQASFIDAKVSSGAYASPDEVVQAGLEALQDREDEVERWLRDEVVPALDALEADPDSAVPVETVMEEILAHHAKRLSQGRDA